MKIALYLWICAFIVFGCSGSGTADGVKQYKFNCTNAAIQSCMELIKREYVALDVPDRWVQYGNWEKKNDFPDGIVVSFEGDGIGGPRMYYISLEKQTSSDTASTAPSYVAVRAMFSEIDGNPKWTPADEAEATDLEVAAARIRFMFNKFNKRCSCEMIKS
ncbi:MAG TPA: hypothetical protein VFE50_19880 [Cyclobacteriaceae bacterium]|nr:hypothetical protein [Cyclobacteriaceae bacterium]